METKKWRQRKGVRLAQGAGKREATLLFVFPFLGMHSQACCDRGPSVAQGERVRRQVMREESQPVFVGGRPSSSQLSEPRDAAGRKSQRKTRGTHVPAQNAASTAKAKTSEPLSEEQCDI